MRQGARAARRRFQEREARPLKHWKLSRVDKASLDKWEEYAGAMVPPA